MADAAPAPILASLSRGLDRAPENRPEPLRRARLEVHLDASYGAGVLARSGRLRIGIENQHHVDSRR